MKNEKSKSPKSTPKKSSAIKSEKETKPKSKE